MLSSRTIFNKIKKNAPVIRAHRISKLGLFGSYQRNEQKPNSDIDIWVDFKEGQETFDNFIETYLLLENLFKGDTVDVVTVNGLSPHFGPHILKSVEYVEINN